MIIGCPDCGTIQEMPRLVAGGKLVCHRCRNTLERATGRSLTAALACSTATLLLLFPANLMPLLSLSTAGLDRQSVLVSGAVGMWRQGWPLLAIVVGLQGVALPFFRFAMLSAALAAIRSGRQRRWTGRVFRWSERLDLWAMPDVFLIGGAIGYGRIIPFVPVRIGAGGWCLIAAALLSLLTRAVLDRHSTWRMLGTPRAPGSGAAVACTATIACTECGLVVAAGLEGRPCPRCAARLQHRKPFSIRSTAALVTAGYLFYPMANYFPMSIQTQLGATKDHTIAAGIEQLVSAGFWPLAIVIFCTSIAIPLLKLVGLTWLMWSVHRRSTRALVFKTRLYRTIVEIGRWSNVDVFTIAIFLPLIQFGSLASVRAATGAPAFLAVIVLTMFAARVFDPRLMWDPAADEPR